MAYKKDEDYLNPLEKKLYKKDAEFSYERQKLSKHQFDTKGQWEELNGRHARKKIFVESSLLIKLFFVSLMFFIFAVGIAGYMFLIKDDGSAENVDIVVKAPPSVEGGEETSFQVIITNNDNITVENVNLEIKYPEGATPIDTPTMTNNLYRKSLGNILPGTSVTETLAVVLYGQENTEKEFIINIEYRVPGSSATFLKDKVYKVVLATAPVSLSVDIPAEINLGEEMTVSVKTNSNSTNVLEDFMVIVEYPFGFKFEGANPRPSMGDNIWLFGNLTPSDDVEIDIKGRMEGELQQQKTFKIFTGVQDKKDEWKMDIVYNSVVRAVPVKASVMGVTYALNGNATSQEVAVRANASVHGSVSWTNTSPDSVVNGEIKVIVTGPILDERSVYVEKGAFSSLTNTITWNQISDRSLGVMEPGESGVVSFTFDPYSLSEEFQNPELSLKMEFTGERISPGFPNEKISVTESRKVKITTIMGMTSYGLHFVGEFANTGPVPPKVDTETTYTAVWSITNTSNKVNNIKVKSSIPLYVSWKGQVFPADENVTYNDLTGEIVWDVGNIPAGLGTTYPARVVNFQLGLLPSANQIGLAPLLLDTTEIEGKDMFTGVVLTEQVGPVTTTLRKDPQFRLDHAAVVP